MFGSSRILRRMLAGALVCAGTVLLASGVAAAQEDPFVTSGPGALGERVSESDQATQRLNMAVFGLLGLAALVSVGTVAFWRMSAPMVERVQEVQPAFRIEHKSSSPGPTAPTAPPRPPSQPAFAVPTVATIRVEPEASGGAWASQGWGSDDGA